MKKIGHELLALISGYSSTVPTLQIEVRRLASPVSLTCTIPDFFSLQYFLLS